MIPSQGRVNPLLMPRLANTVLKATLRMSLARLAWGASLEFHFARWVDARWAPAPYRRRGIWPERAMPPMTLMMRRAAA